MPDDTLSEQNIWSSNIFLEKLQSLLPQRVVHGHHYQLRLRLLNYILSEIDFGDGT